MLGPYAKVAGSAAAERTEFFGEVIALRHFFRLLVARFRARRERRRTAYFNYAERRETAARRERHIAAAIESAWKPWR